MPRIPCATHSKSVTCRQQTRSTVWPYSCCLLSAERSLDFAARALFCGKVDIDYLSKTYQTSISQKYSNVCFCQPSIIMSSTVLQSASRHRHSTETAILLTLNSIYTSADSGNATLFISFDLSTAFDTTDHSLLLSWLRNSFGVYGFLGYSCISIN